MAPGNDRILRSETHLTTQHTPEKPVKRESELRRIANALRPLTENRTPENLLIHGPAGIGKTTCVKQAFNQLDETHVNTVHINCWQYNTRPSLLTELLVQLGYPAPRKGKPVDELLSRLQEFIDKSQGVAVALDEFDQLKDQTEVIYDLQQASADADNKLGLIMVSNQHPTNIRLDPRSKSRLTCGTLAFRPYTADQLTDILKQRAERAFHPDTVADDVIEHIADSVAEESGDCRQALNMLLRAGRKADQEDADRVGVPHLPVDTDQ